MVEKILRYLSQLPIYLSPTKKDKLTVVFFGKTGVGKSSTLNALFGLNWATDNAVACTKKPQFFDLNTSNYADFPERQVWSSWAGLLFRAGVSALVAVGVEGQGGDAHPDARPRPRAGRGTRSLRGSCDRCPRAAAERAGGP